MASISHRNFNRWTINKNNGSMNNCFPSIIATLTGIDTSAAEAKCQGFPARSGRKPGGTRIKWNNPAQQITTSFGIAATDVVDVSENTNYNMKKHGTLSSVARNLDEGAYVIIHRGHAFGLLVVDGVGYTVDYGRGNASRRIVWTCTRLDSVDARAVLATFTGVKPNHFKVLRPVVAPKPTGNVKEVFVINGVSKRTTRKEAAMCANCSVGRIAELVRDARAAGGILTKTVKGNEIRIMLCA